MIDLERIDPTNQLLTLTEATKLPFLARNGRRPALTTLLRWARTGINGKRLETLRIGRSLVTTREHILKFIAATSAGECSGAEALRKQLRERRAEAAGARLKAKGA